MPAVVDVNAVLSGARRSGVALSQELTNTPETEVPQDEDGLVSPLGGAAVSSSLKQERAA